MLNKVNFKGKNIKHVDMVKNALKMEKILKSFIQKLHKV